MATTTVLQFMQRTADDEALRQQLEALLGVGDGNISSEAELDPNETEALGERAPVVAEFATAQGFNFSADELVTVVDAFHKHQTGELSDQSFEAILGIAMDDHTDETAEIAIKNPLKRLSSYLSKTYLGY